MLHLSKLQRLPAHSSCEAGLIAAGDLVRELMFLVSLMKEFNIRLTRPLQILEDNQSTISLCYNKVQQQRSKHIDVRYFYIRHIIKHGLCAVRYIPSEWNAADNGTKALGRPLFERHVKVMSGHEPPRLDLIKKIR